MPSLRLGLLTLVLLFLNLSVDLGPRPSHWAPERYQDTDLRTFLALPLGSQTIDMRAPDLGLLNAALFFETNRRRALEGLPSLSYAPSLELSARVYAQEMAELGYVSHESPIPGHRTLAERMVQVGVDRGYHGENIIKKCAYRYQEGRPVYPPEVTGSGFRYDTGGTDLPPLTYQEAAQVLLDQWMDSPGHRENILNKNFSYLGCGAVVFREKAFHGMEYIIAVQHFSSYPGR